jgi:hypothetical protein
MNDGRKLVKQIIILLRERGWRIEMGSKHYKIYPPDRSKRGMALPCSPSDRRAVYNMLTEIRARGTELPLFGK